MVCIYNVYQKVNNKLEQPNKGKESHKRNRRMKDRVATHNTLHAALYTRTNIALPGSNNL